MSLADTRYDQVRFEAELIDGHPHQFSESIRRGLIGEKVGTLGGQGFVVLEDFMGSDMSICKRARISTGSALKLPKEDRALLRYLLRHGHTTPIEMAELIFHIRIPMDAHRQLVRHRTATINEYSTRYQEAIDEMATTPPGAWRKQTESNRQGSGSILPLEEGTKLSEREAYIQAEAQKVYQERIAAGVAREQARKDLPLSTFTELYWKIDLHNLLHFVSLRDDQHAMGGPGHAQQEIREYGRIMGDFVRVLYPWCWEAFNDFHPRRGAVTMTRQDMKALSDLLCFFCDPENLAEMQEAIKHAMEDTYDHCTTREKKEFLAKLRMLGIPQELLE